MGDKILDDDHCSSLSLSSTELSDEGDSVRSDSSRHRVKDLKRQTEKWAECTAEWRERWEKMKIDRDAILKKARHYKHKLEKTRDKVDSLEDTIKELKEENTTLREKLSTIECQDDEGMDQFERRGTVRFRRRSEPVRRQSPTSTLAAMKDEGLGSSAESTSPPATPGGLDLSAFSLSPTLKIIEDLVSKHGTAVTDSSQQEGPAASPLTSRSPPVTRGHQENELRDDFSFWKLKKSALSQSASMPAIVHATGAKKTVESRPRTATAPRRKDPGADNAASGKKSSSGPLPSSSQVPSRPVEPKVIPSRSTSARPESRLPTRPDSRVNSATPTSAPPTAAPNTNSKPPAAMATGPRSTNPSSTERSTSVRPGDGRQTSRKSDGRSKGPSFLDLASRKAMYTAAVMLSEKTLPPLGGGASTAAGGGANTPLTKLKAFSHSQDSVTPDLISGIMSSSSPAVNRASHIPSDSTKMSTSSEKGKSQMTTYKSEGCLRGNEQGSGDHGDTCSSSGSSDPSNSPGNTRNSWVHVGSDVSPITTPMASPRPSGGFAHVVTTYATRLPLRRP